MACQWLAWRKRFDRDRFYKKTSTVWHRFEKHDKQDSRVTWRLLSELWHVVPWRHRLYHAVWLPAVLFGNSKQADYERHETQNHGGTIRISQRWLGTHFSHRCRARQKVRSCINLRIRQNLLIIDIKITWRHRLAYIYGCVMASFSGCWRWRRVSGWLSIRCWHTPGYTRRHTRSWTRLQSCSIRCVWVCVCSATKPTGWQLGVHRCAVLPVQTILLCNLVLQTVFCMHLYTTAYFLSPTSACALAVYLWLVICALVCT